MWFSLIRKIPLILQLSSNLCQWSTGGNLNPRPHGLGPEHQPLHTDTDGYSSYVKYDGFPRIS